MNKLSLHKTLWTLLFAYCFFLTCLQAQFTPQWERKFYHPNYLQAVKKVVSAPDGGFVAIALVSSYDDGVLVRLDANGNELWRKRFELPGWDIVNDVVVLSDGSVVATGTKSGQGPDAWVVKLDAGGNVLWEKLFGGSAYDEMLGLTATPDGNFICVGYSKSTNGHVGPTPGHTVNGAWAIKVDGTGNLLWSKKYGFSGIETKAVDVVADPAGGYVVAASSKVTTLGGDVPASFGGYDYWMFKIDDQGSLHWSKVYGGAGSDVPNKIIVLQGGGFLLSGTTTSSQSGTITQTTTSGDAWLVKIGGDGNIDWQKNFTHGTEPSIAASTAGEIYVSGSLKPNGSIYDDVKLTQLDASGNVLADTLMGYAFKDVAYDITPAADGGMVLAGESYPASSSGNGSQRALWLVKVADVVSPAYIDLELNLFADPFNPPAYSKSPVKATLVNRGNLAATGVKVHFPKPGTVVYFGGEEYIASQGTFDYLGNETWTVGSLAPGDTAVLLVNYFPLAAQVTKAYAQVIAANEPDYDSSINNGISQNTYPEDDEASELINVGNVGGVLQFQNVHDLVEMAWLDGLGVTVNLKFSQELLHTCTLGYEVKPILPVPANNYFPVGSTPVCLEATDNCGNRDTACFNVIVNTAVTSPVFSSQEYELRRFSQHAPFADLGIVIADAHVQAGNMLQIADHACYGIFPGAPKSLTVKVHVYASANSSFDSNDLLLFSGPVTASSPSTDYVGLVSEGSLGQFTLPANTPTGWRYLLFRYDAEDEVPELSEDNQRSIRVYVDAPASTPAIDLSLHLEQTVSSPHIGSTFSLKVKALNAGPGNATGMSVRIPQPTGAAYQTGNNYISTHGTFQSANGEGIWTLGDLPANDTAVLILHFNLTQDAYPNCFAEVAAANEQDADSTPGNANGFLANEDDEAAINNQAEFPDILFTSGSTALQITAGTDATVNYQLTNGGDADVFGDYQIKLYISQDAMLDAGDQEIKYIERYGLPIGSVIGTMDFQLPLLNAPGQRYLILQADALGEIDEQDENNNLFAIAFDVLAPAICDVSGLFLDGQEMVNQFPGCPVINGYLYITGTDVTDLSPLSNLTTVNGLVELYGTSVTNVDPFSNLTTAASLQIRENDQLLNLDGFSGLEGAIDYLYISDNDNLENIQGLSGITTANVLVVNSMPGIQNLSGLDNVTQVNNQLYVGDLENLTDIGALGQLKKVTKQLVLTSCPSLTNLNGLNQLTTVGEWFFLYDLDGLHDLNGLSVLKNLDTITIAKNAALQSLAGFGPQVNIHHLQIYENPNLADCCNLNYTLKNNLITGPIEIYDNAFGCQSKPEILAECQQSPCVSSVTLTTQAQVDAFPGCPAISGNLTISGSNIVDLTPLAGLEQILGNLNISGCNSLTNLTGLNDLQQVNDITILDNPNLVSISALGNVASTGAYALNIRNNASLANLQGLEGITNVTVLYVTDNPSLTSLSGLQNLKKTNNQFHLVNNAALTHVNGLNGLDHVTQEFRIANNQNLQNLDALSGLIYAQSLRVLNNPKLAMCCGLHPILENNGVQFTIEISGNLPDCNSKTAIDFACTAIDDKIDLELSISNPAVAYPYTSYPVTVTLMNKGNHAATNLQVKVPKPNGVVYTGGNEYNASQGTFNTLTTDIWKPGTLPAGGTATLALNYFLMQNNMPDVYAQVTSANEFDLDSTPNNGTPPTPNEDDEASTTGAVQLPKPDLTVSISQIPASVAVGGNLSLGLTVNNGGTVPVNQVFGSTVYLSSDNILSTGDVVVSSKNITNLATGGSVLVPIDYTIPVGQAPGNFFIIAKTDVQNVIAESDELNNLVVKPILITAASDCSGNKTLSSQAQVDAFPTCPIIDGNLTISGADITSLTPLADLNQVTGDLIINFNPNLLSLEGLQGLTAVGGLNLQGNSILNNIVALSNISGSNLSRVWLGQNDALPNLNGLQGITGTQLLYLGNKNMVTVNGLDNLATVAGDAQFMGNKNLSSLDALSNLTQIGGSFLLVNAVSLADLSGLENLATVGGSLVINFDSSLVNLDGLDNLQSVGKLTIAANPQLANVDALASIATAAELKVYDNASLATCCGLFPILSGNGISGVVQIQNNLPDCNSQHEIMGECGAGASIDLELSISSPASAPAYTSYTTTLTISNKGTQAATGVKVKFAKPNGVVYTGGNEATASQGTFEYFGNEVWNVGTLAPGGNATLTVSYFLLQTSLPIAYAQVTAANEDDVDSTPSNGTPPTPNEDDEASSIGPPPAPKPDLSLNGLSAPDLTPGVSSGFNVDLKVANLAVSGSYTIGIYLSTNNSISADDYQFTSLSEQNTAVGNFARNGTLLLPDNFPLGNYYLILKVDAGDVVSESNEGNNVVFINIAVTSPQVICTGDYIMESQGEVDAFAGCNVIEGSLIIRSPNGSSGASSDIADLSPLLGVKQVTDFLIIENNDQLLNLQGLDNLTAIGGLSIVFCQNLTDIQALAGIQGPLSHISIIGNASLPNLNGLEGVTKTRNGIALDENAALLNLNGFSGLDSVAISGSQYSFSIRDNPALKNIQGLQNLTYVGGSLEISNCTGLESLDGLVSLVTVGRDLVLVDNIQLQDVSSLNWLAQVGQNLPIQRNYLLSDCCIFQNLLNGNGLGGTAFISDNASGCNSISEIQTNCQTQGPDLELSMTSNNTSPSIYTSTKVTLTITNTGAELATGIVVAFPRPAGTVYTGGNEYTLTQGSFNPFGNEQWTVGDIPAGGSATITVNYFLLTSNALTPYAQVVSQNEPDADSSPGNGTCCTANEDDEASVSLNGFTGGNGSTALKIPQDKRQRLWFEQFYPSPAQYWVNMSVYSPREQLVTINIYDQQGRLVKTIETVMEKGMNVIEQFIGDWRSGTYNIVGIGEKGLPAYGRFQKVWE